MHRCYHYTCPILAVKRYLTAVARLHYKKWVELAKWSKYLSIWKLIIFYPNNKPTCPRPTQSVEKQWKF